MERVHPGALAASASFYLTCKQETFTIWMKSLILNGKGCTVFDSNGQIIYRVDNYDRKYSNEVFLMDSDGNVLFALLRKKFRLFKFWEGHRWSEFVKEKTKPAFQVRKNSTIFTRRNSPYQVVVGLDKGQVNQYKIQSRTTKSTYNIVDNFGGIIAQVKRKQSSSGVVLGEEVLAMVVEPQVDHSLIMALVVALSLINCEM